MADDILNPAKARKHIPVDIYLNFGGKRLASRTYYESMRKHQSARVTISASAQQAILMDVCQRPDIEACGIFIGYMDEQGNWFVEEARPLRNIYNSPVYFEFAPEELLQAELTSAGQIIGVYHSHPTGFAIASNTDRNNMQRVNQEQEIPWVWLIISGPFGAEFQEQVRGSLKNASIIAYHHYSEGLRTIAIHLENGLEMQAQSGA